MLEEARETKMRQSFRRQLMGIEGELIAVQGFLHGSNVVGVIVCQKNALQFPSLFRCLVELVP